MARRKQQHLIEPQTMLGMLVVLGTLWLLAKALQNLPNGTGTAVSLIGLVVVGGGIAYPVIRILRRAGARRGLLERVRVTTEQQLEPLLRRRAQLVRLDPYGKPKADKWAEEIKYFVEQHIQPSLGQRERIALKRNYQEVAGLIGARVETVMRDQPAFKTFSDDMTPAEFETFCAEELRRAGWDARVTMQSRDQGVDVVATKNGRRVVLQCKLYSRPVGNKSVQEAAAARSHEQADFGIVVSNSRYTEAAEQLATTNRILLLHHRDLQNLDDILNRLPGPVSA